MYAQDSSTPNPDWLDEAITNAIDFPDHVADAAWKKLTTEHVVPSRLMQLAFGLVEALETDLEHIHSCSACCSQYDYYRVAIRDERNSHAASNGDVIQRLLWPKSDCEAIYGRGKSYPSLFVPPSVRDDVPPSLRKHFLVNGHVIMPGEEVAETTWQFGLLIQLLKESPEVGSQILALICDAAFISLQNRQPVSAKTLALVCFGRAMHRCGIELATRFHDAGLAVPHVILAHDYYDPALVCSRHEFANADVVVLVDVVHSGTLLRRLIAACESFDPVRVTGLTLIDQAPTPLEDVEYRALWSDEIDVCVPLTQFNKQASISGNDTLRRFEPNAECAVQTTDPLSLSKGSSLLPDIDPQLLVHVLATDALKCDHPISGKTYPFVVNVLDLIKKDDKSRNFIASCAKSVLADLTFQKTCFAFHVGRSQRAGAIAKFLSDNTGWPNFSIGTNGSTFILTDKQCRQLACFDNVVIVDAAIRTGETISAITRAVRREFLFNRPRFIAFTILNALASKSQTQVAMELGIEVRSLFNFPLTPPTEEIRHWATAQKVAIGAVMLNNPLFEFIQPILGDYCDTRRKKGRPAAQVKSQTDKIELTRQALAYGQPSLRTAKEIAHACQANSSRVIRHLPINEVVHDSTMQSMLMGVMYNSVPAPLKESAVFGLAAAENFEWMNLQWLKCNKNFLNTSQAWKSVVLVECQMRLNGLMSQLGKFRDAATEFRESLKKDDVEPISCDTFQQSLFADCGARGECRVERPGQTNEHLRLMQRLATFVEVAG